MTSTSLATREELVAYLNKLNIAVLSTSSSNGYPYSAVIYFIADHYLNFYFLTLADTKKAKNLKENKNIALTTIDLPSMISVQTTGIVQEITDPEQYAYMVKNIGKANTNKNQPYWPQPISQLQSIGSLIVYKFVPNWLRIGNYAQKPSATGEKGNIFTEIISAQHSVK